MPSLPTAKEKYMVLPSYVDVLTWLNLMPRLVFGGVMLVELPPSWLPWLGLMLHVLFRFLGVHLAVRVRFWVTGLLKS